MDFGTRKHLGVEGTNLTIGGVDAIALAKRYGTPLYAIDEERIRDNFRRFAAAFSEADVYYAAKANGSLAVLRILAQEGAGADVFSDGELYLALLAGMQPERILFNGNSKTDHELEMACASGVKVSIDSTDELRTLSEIASNRGTEVDIAFRVNPDVSPATHPKIATGLAKSKFGIPHNAVVSCYQEALSLEGVRPAGIHCHIGSQIVELSPFSEMMTKMMDLVEALKNELDLNLDFVDIGSGLGIPYEGTAPTPEDLADTVLPIFHQRAKELEIRSKLILEPGRYVVGDAAILLCGVNTVKKAHYNFVGIDAGFNLLIRPAMYDSYHEVLIANKLDIEPETIYTIAGPICESGDILARNRSLPKVEKGDVIAILDVGAYGFAMSSQYNGRVRASEVLVKAGTPSLIRRRESYSDLLNGQTLPSRLL
ncbi:MAG TPA: diaminopimelate decarboxylase [Candidatus Acidoferrales bacterium]|nr:diaminopimelate decarboxylase [Candidatus Acidoferrales bacterium]